VVVVNLKVRVPTSAKRGEVIEVFALLIHPMESGFRLDNVGKNIPRHIIETFVCTYNGREVFRAKLHPAVTSNPYFAFHLVASESGELLFAWKDDKGNAGEARATLTVI
jgi:sulfur-oxidizing protein SoxZ